MQLFLKFIRKVIRRSFLLVSRPIFILCGFLMLLILKAIRPIIKVRIGGLIYSRIGHLAPNTELFLRRQTRSKDKNEIHIFLTGKPANYQLLTMLKRKIRVSENWFLLKIYENIKPLTSSSDIWINLQSNINEYEEFNDISPQLSFLESEESRGQKLFSEIGIDNESDFVCFHARDKKYLLEAFPDSCARDWEYHDFRDCDINNYLLAAKYLASEKIYCLRMGSVVEKKLPETGKYIIDYATGFRSDFGDVYLPAKCKFFLGNTAGIRMVSSIFNVPIAFSNSVPLGDISLGKKDIFIPKKLWLKNKKRFLTFREIIEMGADWWLKSKFYEQAGIEVIENTPDEILTLTKEMNERLDDVWIDREEDEELQKHFRALFKPGHRCYGFPSRIGVEFLRQNRELLEIK